MQKIHKLRNGFFRLILPCNILEGDTRFLLHIDLRIAFPDTPHHAAVLCQHPEQQNHHDIDQHKRQHIGKDDIKDRNGLIRVCGSIFDPRLLTALLQSRIIRKISGIVCDSHTIFHPPAHRSEHNAFLIRLHLDGGEFSLLQKIYKFAVRNFL